MRHVVEWKEASFAPCALISTDDDAVVGVATGVDHVMRVVMPCHGLSAYRAANPFSCAHFGSPLTKKRLLMCIYVFLSTRPMRFVLAIANRTTIVLPTSFATNAGSHQRGIQNCSIARTVGTSSPLSPNKYS